MYYVIFISILALAILFNLLGYYLYFGLKKVLINKYGTLILTYTIVILVSTVLWFLLSAAVIELEFPYVAMKSDGTVIEGTHVWGDSTAVSLLYLFMLMAVIQILYGLGTIPFLVFDYFKMRYMNKKTF